LTERHGSVSPRKNALLVAVVLAGLTAWNAHRHRLLLVEVLGGLALAVCLVALISPSWTERFNRGWLALGRALGYVNSYVLLSLVYYVVFTPFGFVLRLAGRDPLHRRGPARDSYWIPRETPRQSRIGFEKPF